MNDYFFSIYVLEKKYSQNPEQFRIQAFYFAQKKKMKIPFRIFFIAASLLMCFIFFVFGWIQKRNAEQMTLCCKEKVEENLKLENRIKELEALVKKMESNSAEQ